MKIVIAPDSFKESLDAASVAKCIENGFREVFPDAEYVVLPLADGGEGTVDVLLQGLSGNKHTTEVMGPLGDTVTAQWAMLEPSPSNPKRTALVEIAAASGLDLVDPEKRNPMLATSFGTGQLMLEAIKQGAEAIILGLGGSATNDGGAGIVQALGGKLLDGQGKEIALGGFALSQLTTIDLSELDERLRNIDLTIACDVANPLCGEDGASHIFGPQKGASSEQVQALDSALHHFATVSMQQHPSIAKSDTLEISGYGAAGGTPMGLSLLFAMQLKPGIEMVLDTLNADEVLKGASLVVSGEGQMDNQTLQGKTPFGIALRAQKQGIPTIGIAGSLGTEVDELYSAMGVLFGTVRSPQPLEQVLKEAEINLTRTARNIAATLKLGSTILN
ncbi:glycerate kinase [Vibrio fortis]|uniref:glycerate kinase n=1 Tax=Vibrio fortis TaxID=212667 RepID=UPI002F3F3339